MKSFLKSLFASVLGNLISAVIAGVLVFVVFAALLASAVFSSGPKTTTTPTNAFLVLDLDTTISDTPDQDDGALHGLLGNAGPRIGLWDLTTALSAAAEDKKVRGLLIRGSLNFENYGSGFAALAEVRRAIAAFKKTGKPAVAYLDDPSLKNYYLGTAASTLIVHPYAEVDVRGLASTSPYLGNALKKYGIGVQTTKVGKYKSAVEPFLSDKMSAADREQRQALYDGIWDKVAADIAESRDIPADRLKALSNERGIWDAESARAHKLVDKTDYLDGVISMLKELGAEDDKHGSFAQIHVRDYIRQRRALPAKHPARDAAVAIVYAEGDIVDGSGSGNNIGGDSLAARLREIRRDDDVAAVVLRVNSPGGSAFASEVIQREVRQLASAGKPVVVSMGSYAASGGYWISAYAAHIFAEETTITGSIGVFGLMFNLQDAATSLGIAFDGVKTSRFADIETLSRPKSAEELALLQRQTDRIYDDFVAKVAEGRKQEPARIREIAEGRVWAGAAARKLGLVDAIGGLRDAVEHAAQLAKLEPGDYTVQQHPEARTAWQNFAETFFNSDGETPVARARGAASGTTAVGRERGQTPLPVPSILRTSGRAPFARVLRQLEQLNHTLEQFNDRRGVYARLPWWETEAAGL
jgi:protease-4